LEGLFVKSMPRGIFMMFCFAVSALIILLSGDALIAADDDWYTWYEQQNAQGDAETPGGAPDASNAPDLSENPPAAPDGGTPEDQAPPEGSAGNLPPSDQPYQSNEPGGDAPTWDYAPDVPDTPDAPEESAERADAVPPEETPVEVAETAEIPPGGDGSSGGTTAALPDQIDWGASYDPYKAPEPSQPEATVENAERVEEYAAPEDEQETPVADEDAAPLEEPGNEDII
jgi:hypothetical protein